MQAGYALVRVQQRPKACQNHTDGLGQMIPRQPMAGCGRFRSSAVHYAIAAPSMQAHASRYILRSYILVYCAEKTNGHVIAITCPLEATVRY